MDTVTIPGASLPNSVFDAIKDGGWSIESQLARVHYSKAGRRYGLTYAELLLRALEVAASNDVEREICARLSLYAFFSPDVIEHAKDDPALARAVADRVSAIRAELGAHGGPEIADRAEYAIEVAVKVYFDEARDQSRRRKPSREYPVLYFDMDYDDALCCSAAALERLALGPVPER